MKVNISISKDGNNFEEFANIDFKELDGLTDEERKEYIENYCKTAVTKIAEGNIENEN